MKFLIDLFSYHFQLLSHYLSASFQDSVFDILLVVRRHILDLFLLVLLEFQEFGYFWLNF